MQEKRFWRKPKDRYFIAKRYIDQASIVSNLSDYELYQAPNFTQMNRIFERFEQRNGRGGYQYYVLFGNKRGYATKEKALKAISRLKERNNGEKAKTEREKTLYCH